MLNFLFSFFLKISKTLKTHISRTEADIKWSLNEILGTVNIRGAKRLVCPGRGS